MLHYELDELEGCRVEIRAPASEENRDGHVSDKTHHRSCIYLPRLRHQLQVIYLCSRAQYSLGTLAR
jgi:hypothetical protein